MENKKHKSIIILGIITSFITAFMGSGLNLSIPALEEEFSVSTKSIGWVMTVYMLTCAVLAIPWGRIADKLEKRKILLAGIFVFGASSGIAGFSKRLWMLLICRFLQAVGASMIFSTNIAMMAASAGEKKRGHAVGYAVSSNYTGMAAGPVLGGILSHNLGWKSIFLVVGAVSAASFIFGILSIPKERECEREVRKQTRIKTLLADKAFLYGNGAALINYGANYTMSYMLSVYLQAARGMSSQNAGFVLVTGTVVMAVLAPVFGRLSDRISPNKLSAAGMALSGAAIGFFVFVDENVSLIKIAAILAVAGVGFAMFSSPNTTAVMQWVKKEDYGLASSALSAMRSFGNTLGMGIITTVTGIYMGSGNLKNADMDTITKVMHCSFAIFAILCIIGIFMATRKKM